MNVFFSTIVDVPNISWNICVLKTYTCLFKMQINKNINFRGYNMCDIKKNNFKEKDYIISFIRFISMLFIVRIFPCLHHRKPVGIMWKQLTIVF